jgi:hypothetical protein
MSETNRQLTIDTADTVAEISVLDGNLNPITSGVGGFSVQLPVGLYKVRIRVGPTVRERLVSLDADRRELFDMQAFPSPIPLQGTSQTHEYQIAAAQQTSGQPKVQLGSGATIFVFAREWSHPNKVNPADGLRLLDAGGKLLVDLENMAEVRTDGDASAGCTVAVDPGHYRLRLEGAEGDTLERALIAISGWQTQIFVLQRDDGKARRADLAGGAVVMSHSGKFQPNDDLTRLSALASYALTQHRKIMSEQLRQVLSGKFEDPILGLFGAYLIARDCAADHRLLDTVLGNLSILLGKEHPDVRALALRRNAASDPPVEEFPSVPMLRPSWDLIVEATIRGRCIVPVNSPAGVIAPSVVPSFPWLTWREATVAKDGRHPRMVALVDYLRARTLADRPQSLLRSTEVAELPAARAQVPDLDDDTKVEVARSFGVPQFVLEDMLNKLANNESPGPESLRDPR